MRTSFKFVGICLSLGSLNACVTSSHIKQTQDQLDQRVQSGDFEPSLQSAVKKLSGTCTKIDSDVRSYEFTSQDKVVLQKEVNGVKSYSYFKLFCAEWSPTKVLDVSVIGSHVGGGAAKAYMVIPLVFLFDEKFHQVTESAAFVKLNQGAIQFGEVLENWSYSGSDLKTKRFFVVVESDNKNPIDRPRGYTPQGVPFYPYPTGEFQLSLKASEL